MGSKKRSYVPKIKGCYECSQRRIDCDRAQPSCAKCASRGIPCSGLGVRYRFCDGFAPSRTNKSARRRVLSPRNLDDTAFPLHTSSPSGELLRDDTDGHVSAGDPSGNIVGGKSFHFSSPSIDRGSDEGIENRHWSLLPYNLYSSTVREIPCDYVAESLEVTGCRLHSIRDRPCKCTCPPPVSTLLTSTLGYIEPWKESLLKYCKQVQIYVCVVEPFERVLTSLFGVSDNIAPEMVVIDDSYNGWRHLTLPIACIDDLVMNAVLAVSAFHLSGRAAGDQKHVVPDPTRLYARAICELQNRRDLENCDSRTRQFVILAIVVLLVAVMVNGQSDFPIMFRMLQSALEAVGGETGLADGDVDLAEFSLRQIHKMRVYAAPLLSPDAGVHAIVSEAQQSFDCLHYYHRLHPDCSPTFGLIADLRQQAFNIYLQCVLAQSTADMSTATCADLIENFKITLESSFPEGSPGEHVLVWASFIAASECRVPEQQLFFTQFLERQYRRNGFVNILKALELLKRIWARSVYENWPALLPGPQVFIM